MLDSVECNKSLLIAAQHNVSSCRMGSKREGDFEAGSGLALSHLMLHILQTIQTAHHILREHTHLHLADAFNP